MPAGLSTDFGQTVQGERVCALVGRKARLGRGADRFPPFRKRLRSSSGSVVVCTGMGVFVGAMPLPIFPDCQNLRSLVASRHLSAILKRGLPTYCDTHSRREYLDDSAKFGGSARCGIGRHCCR